VKEEEEQEMKKSDLIWHLVSRSSEEVTMMLLICNKLKFGFKLLFLLNLILQMKGNG
jgi:hypothetical protein